MARRKAKPGGLDPFAFLRHQGGTFTHALQTELKPKPPPPKPKPPPPPPRRIVTGPPSKGVVTVPVPISTPAPSRSKERAGPPVPFKPAPPVGGYVPPSPPPRYVPPAHRVVTQLGQPHDPVLSHVFGVAESVLPMQHGHFGLVKPEIVNRYNALTKTLAVGVMGGSKAGAGLVARQYEHDKRRGDYVQAKIQLERQKDRPLTPLEDKHLAAGYGVNMLEHGPLSAQTFENIGLGTAGVVAGAVAHPIKTVKDIAKMGVEIPIGTGLLVAAMSRPDLTPDQRWEMWKQAGAGLKKQYADALGGEGTDAFWHSFHDPVNTALLFPVPLSAGAQTLRVATLLRGGRTLEDAIRLTRDPAVERTVTFTQRGAKLAGGERRVLPDRRGPSVKTTVTIPQSSSVLARTTLQKPYDAISWVADRTPGLRALPIAESKRAAAAAGKTMLRTKDRRTALGNAYLKEVHDFLNEGFKAGVPGLRGKNEHYATTIAALVMKPNGFTDNEWEQAVIQNMKDMLADPERMHLPGDKVSPAEQRLRNRIANYDRKAEVARVSKRSLTMKRLHEEQVRLSTNLDGLAQERHQAYDNYLAASGDERDRYAGLIQALDTESQVMRERLAEVTVNEPPIETPARDQARAVMEGIPYFQEHPQAIEDALAVNDAVAHHYARVTGETPESWWEKRDVRHAAPEDIPLEAYAQDRPAGWRTLDDITPEHIGQLQAEYVSLFGEDALTNPIALHGEPEFGRWAEHQLNEGLSTGGQVFHQTRSEAGGVPNPAALDAKAQEIYDRYGHLSGAMPDDVKNAGDFAAKSHEVARLATLGADHRHWYRDSGLAIRDRIGPNNWTEARQIAAAVAYLSRTDSVMANVGHAMRAFLSYKETGDAGLAGRYPRVANDKLNQIFKHNAWGGYKTNSFFRNILEEYDPARFKKEFGKAEDNVKLDLGGEGDEVTVDRWIVRAFGFADDKVSQKGRYFAAREMIQHISDQLGWTPKETQAAIWVAVKAESDAAKEAAKVAERNVKNKGKYDARVAKAAETGRGGPRSEWKPETPKTVDDFLAPSGVHVGTSLDRISHQLRVNAEAAPGSTYAGFPEYADFSPLAQEEFSHEVARGVYDYYRKLGIPHVPGEHGPGLFEPEGMPIETNPAFAVNVSIGSAMRRDTAEKYGLERVPDWQRREFDAIVAGQGRGTRQNAMPWLRPLIPENVADETATFVERNNLSTDDMLALRAARGDADWQIAIGHGDGGVWFSLVKDQGMSVEDFRAKVATMVDKVLGPDAEAVDFAHEGGYVVNDWNKGSADYEEAISNSRRSGEIRGASDTLANHYESARVRFTSHPDGPDGAARQHRANRLARERRTRQPGSDAPRGLEDPPVFGRVQNQSRRSDTLGATQLVNSATGQRIIWLTQNADFSTVIHEMLGHAAEEMQNLHPQEFAKVEQVIGKPLSQWETADHEKFATWFERYLSEGHAPTPELVPAFERAKQWMRVIYSQIKRALGGRIPPATRDLFEHYLGGWDSENTSRIAVNMGHYDPSESAYAGARMAAQDELATLEKRNATRRFNKSMDGMIHELGQLQKAADERGAMNEAEREQLAAKIVRLQAEIILRSDKRVQSLQSKVTDMEKALTRDPNNRRFSGAVEAAKWLMQDRERILKEVFGEQQFEELFGNRRDLLANYLVQHGLLQPDFEHGTGTYFPMKLDEGFMQAVKLSMQPASNRVIGQISKAALGVHHRNEMIRWQAGDWSADPTVLQLAHSRATAYQLGLEIRDLVHGMGRPLTFAEQEARFPDKVFLINKEGTPLSPTLKRQTRGMTNTTDADMLDDGLFGDDAKLEASLEAFYRNSFIDPTKELPPDFNLADPNLRVVDQAAIKAIFRPTRLNTGGKYLDWASMAARYSLIYANFPGYLITNGLGNLVFLTGQQGLNWIPRTVAYSKMLRNDSKLRHRIMGEMGHTHIQSAVNYGRGFSQVAPGLVMKAESAWMRGLSKVDEYPRYIAWLAEANKAGYYRKSDLLRLLDGKTTKTLRDRERVAERANQHMIDFAYRVSQREKDTLGRLFFIWPYVRGATALPFWYAKNYPARTALIAQLALQQRAYQQSVLGALPPGREDLYPYSRSGNQAVAVPTRFLSPAGPLPDEVRLASDTVASLFGRNPDNLSARLSSLLSPAFGEGINVFTGRDQYGRDQSLAAQLKQPYGIFDSLIPFERMVRGIYDEQAVPRALRQDINTKSERAKHQFLRLEPETYTVPWLNAAAESQGAKSTQQKIDDAVAANMKHFHEVKGAKTHYPNALRKQVAAKVIYQDRLTQLEHEQAAANQFIPKQRDDGSWDVQYHADAYDQAVVAYGVLKQNLPEVLAAHPSFAKSPNEYLAERALPPRSSEGLDFAHRYVQFFNDMISKPPGPKGILPAKAYDDLFAHDVQRKTYRSEKARGVYRKHQQLVARG